MARRIPPEEKPVARVKRRKEEEEEEEKRPQRRIRTRAGGATQLPAFPGLWQLFFDRLNAADIIRIGGIRNVAALKELKTAFKKCEDITTRGSLCLSLLSEGLLSGTCAVYCANTGLREFQEYLNRVLTPPEQDPGEVIQRIPLENQINLDMYTLDTMTIDVYAIEGFLSFTFVQSGGAPRTYLGSFDGLIQAFVEEKNTVRQRAVRLGDELKIIREIKEGRRQEIPASLLSKYVQSPTREEKKVKLNVQRTVEEMEAKIRPQALLISDMLEHASTLITFARQDVIPLLDTLDVLLDLATMRSRLDEKKEEKKPEKKEEKEKKDQAALYKRAENDVLDLVTLLRTREPDSDYVQRSNSVDVTSGTRRIEFEWTSTEFEWTTPDFPLRLAAYLYVVVAQLIEDGKFATTRLSDRSRKRIYSKIRKNQLFLTTKLKEEERPRRIWNQPGLADILRAFRAEGYLGVSPPIPSIEDYTGPPSIDELVQVYSDAKRDWERTNTTPTCPQRTASGKRCLALAWRRQLYPCTPYCAVHAQEYIRDRIRFDRREFVQLGCHDSKRSTPPDVTMDISLQEKKLSHRSMVFRIRFREEVTPLRFPPWPVEQERKQWIADLQSVGTLSTPQRLDPVWRYLEESTIATSRLALLQLASSSKAHDTRAYQEDFLVLKQLVIFYELYPSIPGLTAADKTNLESKFALKNCVSQPTDITFTISWPFTSVIHPGLLFFLMYVFTASCNQPASSFFGVWSEEEDKVVAEELAKERSTTAPSFIPVKRPPPSKRTR